MRHPVLALALVLTAAPLLSGCLEDPATVEQASGGLLEDASAVTHVLHEAVEPEELTAPTFSLLGAVAKGGPAYGAGEPSVWVDLDGVWWLAFPGCDTGFYLVDVPGQPSCDHGLVYKSVDEGGTWERLNDPATGRLTDDGPDANGDVDVTVDAAGTIYTSNLGSGIQVAMSDDGGATWSYVGNVVPEGHWADRQWMAAAAPGHLIMAWMGGNLDEGQRAVAVNTTFDGGANWTGVTYLGENIGWLGTVQFAPDGEAAYLPFTQLEDGFGVFNAYNERTFSLQVARTLDGGATWDVVDTGVTIQGSGTGGHWSGSLMAPALDVTGDGTVVVAWSEERLAAGGVTSDGAVLKVVTSPDRGANWSTPLVVSERHAAIMPWVTGGAGDRFAVTYFASDLPGDTDYAGRWDVAAAVVDGTDVVETVLEADVHLGGLCSKGGGCFFSGSDRALLDFFESDVTPDGRLVVVYPADPVEGGKYIEIRVAVQNGGSPLFLGG